MDTMYIPTQPHHPSRPFYRGLTILRKIRRDAQCGRKHRSSANRNPDMQLLDHEIEEVVRAAKLTRRQIEALLHRLRIRRCRGVPRQIIFRRYQRALARINAAYNVYPYAGLWEVYRSEQKRGRF